MRWYHWILIGLLLSSGVWLWYIMRKGAEYEKMQKVRDAKGKKDGDVITDVTDESSSGATV